jgi:hypothetical protein
MEQIPSVPAIRFGFIFFELVNNEMDHRIGAAFYRLQFKSGSVPPVRNLMARRP